MPTAPEERAADTSSSDGGAPDLLGGLRQRLEARRAVLAAGNPSSSRPAGRAAAQQPVEEADAAAEGQEAGVEQQHRLLTADNQASDEQQQQQQGQLQQQQQDAQQGFDRQPDQLLLVDLVSFDHCQELVQIPPSIEQQVLMQFDVGAWSQPLPSLARQQADKLRRVPQENVGLWVPAHPRANNSSLYKLEQRLAKGRTIDTQRIAQELQEQFPGAQRPAAVGPNSLGPGGLWLDENGLMVYEPSPAKPNKERTWRCFDQDAASTATRWVPATAASLNTLNSSASYRLDVELGRLEFEVHPYMALEQQLAAQLLCSFREYHRRASFGLSAFYGQKLAAFEDALLNAREALFSSQQELRQQGEEQQLFQLLAAVTEAEREVAEVRQLRQEEDALLLEAVQGMGKLWQQLQDVRARQRGRQLTDMAFSVVQLPPAHAEEAPFQADGLTRQQLDIALLVAEAEPIAGLPAYPEPLPVSQSDAELSGFKLRRVECMCSSHALVRAELQDRLQLLEDRVSADPDDPEIQHLRQQLLNLGPVPVRQELSHQEEMQLWTWAEQEVAAGRAGVYRPPRLQPCLSVLPAADSAAATHQGALGSSTGSAAGAGAAGPAAAGAAGAGVGRSRLGQGQLQGTQLQQLLQSTQTQKPSNKQQQSQVDAAGTGPHVAGLGAGKLLPVQAHRLPQKLSYYVRLLVNGRVVDTSEVLQLRDDFTLSFRDVFSIRVLKWPQSMQMELWEKGTFRDTLVAEFYLATPGLGGSPHVDPQAKPYCWTSQNPVPHNRLLRAVEALQPFGALPAAQTLTPPGQQQWQAAHNASAHSSSGGSGGNQSQAGAVLSSPVRARAAAALDVEGGSGGSSSGAAARNGQEAQEGAAEHAAHASTHIGSSGSSSVAFAAMYPSGRLFVRCGWVADLDLAPHFTPFQHTDNALTIGYAKDTALQQSLRLPPHSSSSGVDGAVQVTLTGRPAARTATAAGVHPGGFSPGASPSGSPSKQHTRDFLGASAYTNPLATHSPSNATAQAAAPPAAAPFGSPRGSPSKTGWFGGSGAAAASATAAADVMIGNPLAHLGEDVEVGQTVAPPMPPLKADRALQRVAQGVGHKASAASKWLSRRCIDPNDPRNALLLELLKAREAAAFRGQGMGGAGVFRLDLPMGLSLGVDRVGERRAAFIRQRWTAGPFRSSSSAPSQGSLQGAGQLRVTAPLSAKDTLDLQDAHREALTLIEAASMGVGGFMGALGVAALAAPTVADAGGPGGGKGGASLAAAAASLVARQERALKWSQGVLARALETREASLKSFALRLRATASKLGGGRMGGQFKTDDVVRDIPLPEFKLDLSTLAAAFAPVRPLRPQRRVMKKLQASVPRDTQLVITVQRASNLPRRIAAGGGGVRAQSPNRMNAGGRVSQDRFGSRGTSSFNRSSQFAAAGGSRFGSSGGTAARDAEQRAGLGGAAVNADGVSASAAALMGREVGDPDGSSSCLSCFVEVHFRGKRQRTTAVDSNAPIWNEQLMFPVLGIDQEASPRGICNSDSMVTINVFDEVVTPSAALKAMRAVARASGAGLEPLSEGGVLPERERRFVGCIRLSLAALYQAEVVDGVFVLDVPPVLFGYVADNGRPASLALYLTLKPRLAPPVLAALDDRFTPGEQGDVTRHARKWVTGISSMPACKSRVIKALAVDPEGVATLLPRYLAPTPLPPPLAAAAQQVLGMKTADTAAADPSQAASAPAAATGPLNLLGTSSNAGTGGSSSSGGRASGSSGGSNPASSSSSSVVSADSPASALDQLMLAAARWVAHLPVVGHSWLGRQQQSRPWVVHADVVHMAAAGPEEHAHLLAGFFLQLGQQAFVVLGSSLSGAQAAFVLTTGQPYSPPSAAPSAAAAAAAAASTGAAAGADDATAAAGAAADAATGAAAGKDASSSTDSEDVAAQHHRLRQRLAAAAAAAQARQRVVAAVAAAAAAANPALEAAAAAEVAGVMAPFNVARLRLWDPLTGRCVPARDPSCELRQVGCVYTVDNIWANIQDSGHPWDISWHLGDDSAWKAFFGPVLPLRELASIQVAPRFSELEGRFYEELEASAEEAVRDALYEARSVVVTQPNNKLSRVLKSMLKELPGQVRAINAASLASSLAMSDMVAAVAGPAAAEAAREQLQRRLQMLRSLQFAHNDRVSREMRGCLINGHILAVPFSDNYAEAVAQAVINSGVHRTVDPRVKFAMAAYVERLGAAFVACIWVYVAAIRETS